jgi:predicted nucleotidyltransferase
LLSEHLAVVHERYRVSRLALFGSAARGELHTDSDIGILVEFDGGTTFDRYFDLQAYLEVVFGRHIDLVTEKGLKARARRHVEKDLIRVA